MSSFPDFQLPSESSSSPSPNQSKPPQATPEDIILPEGQGVFYSIPAELYHGSVFINRSKLGDFHESPEQFHHDHVLGLATEDKEKKCFVEGRALHCITLEGREKFDREFTHIPRDLYESWGHPNSNAHKAAKAAFMAMNAGKQVLTSEEYANVIAMSERVHANPDFAMLLSKGHPEVTMRAKTPKYGYMVQCRADWLNREGCELTNGEPYLFDLKSVDDFNCRNWKRVWLRDLWKWGYHRQEAFYTGISEQLLGVQRFIFGLVSKTEPHCTVLAEIDPIHHEIAFREIREDLEQLGECYRSDVWQDPMPRGIQMVEATAWQVREGMN